MPLRQPYNRTTGVVRDTILESGGVHWPSLTAVVDELRTAGVDVPAAERAYAALRVFDDALAGRSDPLAGVSLLDLSPEEFTRALRATASHQALHLTARDLGPAVQQRIGGELVAALVADSEVIVAGLRRSFDPAAAVVHAARDAGLSADTTAVATIEAGDEAVHAWRDLAGAAAVLDRVTATRLSLAALSFRRVPIDAAPSPVQFILTGLTDPAAVEGAAQVAFPGREELSMTPAARWLRLTQYGGLRLASDSEAIAATAAVDEEWESPPPVLEAS